MTTMRAPRLHIAKDGTRTWQVRFREGGRGSKERSETFPRERDAKRFSRWVADYGVTEALALVKSQQSAAASEPTLAEWCTDHVDHLTGVTPGTVARYRSYIEHDLGTLAHLPLSTVTPRAIGAWVNAMESAGAAGKTIKNKHGFLSAAMNAAVRAEKVRANPCRGTRLPSTVTEPMVFLSHDEYVRFLGCFPERWLPLVETLFATGLRWGEATGLRVGDVDCDAGTVTITRAWKYGPDGWFIGPPKSRRSRRTIAIAPETVAVLRPLCDGRPADELLFTNRRGGPVRSSSFHDEAWQPAVRLANGHPARAKKRITKHDLTPLTPPLGKRPRIHDARHSCASWLLAAGVPINVVQAHLGHESITTTVDRYGHLMPAAQAYVREALSLALTASRPALAPPPPA